MDPIHSKRHPGALSAWLPAALWLAAMLLVSVQSVAVTREMLSMVAGAAKGIMGAMVKDGLSAETADLVGKVACAGVVFLGYAVLALLLLRALRLRGTGPRAAYGLSLSGCVLFAVVAELFQVLIPGGGMRPQYRGILRHAAVRGALLVDVAPFSQARQPGNRQLCDIRRSDHRGQHRLLPAAV